MKGVQAPDTSVASLKNLADAIGDLNSSLIIEAKTPASDTVGPPVANGKASGMDISGFSNF
jgi:hypothetical protein